MNIWGKCVAYDSATHWTLQVFMSKIHIQHRWKRSSHSFSFGLIETMDMIKLWQLRICGNIKNPCVLTNSKDEFRFLQATWFIQLKWLPVHQYLSDMRQPNGCCHYIYLWVSTVRLHIGECHFQKSILASVSITSSSQDLLMLARVLAHSINSEK